LGKSVRLTQFAYSIFLIDVMETTASMATMQSFCLHIINAFGHFQIQPILTKSSY